MAALAEIRPEELAQYPEAIEKIIISAMRAKNAEDGISDELDLVEVPEEDEDFEGEEAPYPERPDAPPLMKGGKFGMPDLPVSGTGHFGPRRKKQGRVYRGKKGGVYEIDEATGKKKYKHPKNQIHKSNVIIGGTKIPMLTLLEKAAKAYYDHSGMQDRLAWASILETAYNAGAFPNGTLTHRANYYVGVQLPRLIDKLIEG